MIGLACAVSALQMVTSPDCARCTVPVEPLSRAEHRHFGGFGRRLGVTPVAGQTLARLAALLAERWCLFVLVCGPGMQWPDRVLFEMVLAA